MGKPQQLKEPRKTSSEPKEAARLAKKKQKQKKKHWKPREDKGVDEALALTVDARAAALQLRSAAPTRATLRLATACLLQCVRHVNKEPRAFNSIVRACLRHWVRAADAVLERPSSTDAAEKGSAAAAPSACPRWRKIRVTCKQYLGCVLLLLGRLRDPEAVRAIAQHCLPLMPYFLCLPRTLKPLLRTLVQRWSAGPPQISVLAFLCAHRVAKARKPLREQAARWMLAGYLQSAGLGDSALAVLQQKTLCEMLLTQPSLAYRIAFVHLRHCAVALGRANQERGPLLKAPFYAGLWLWTRLVSAGEELTSLVYPLTQILEALTRALGGGRHLPLRVQCLRMQLHVARQTGATTALLPGALDLLDLADFNKGVASRAVNLEGVTKLSQSQLRGPAFRAAVSDAAYELLAGWVRSACQAAAFPELSLPLQRRLHRLAKACRCRAVAKPIAQLLRLVRSAADWSRAARRRSGLRPIGGGGGCVEGDRVPGRSPFVDYYLRYRTLRRAELERARPGEGEEGDGEGEDEPMEADAGNDGEAGVEEEEAESELSDLPSTEDEVEEGDE